MAQVMAEACRLRLLSGVDELLRDRGHLRVAGVDEAGRGCLAGPVVAAAAVPHPGLSVPGVEDSKAVPAARRGGLAELVRGSLLAWSVAAVSPATIDRINILEASREAMRRALDGLALQPDCAIVDAVSLGPRPYPVVPLVRGDSFSYAVACASILAKVERDGIMRELGERYPHYGFARHKGYAAEEHRRALAEHGPCPVHRLTFRSVVPRRGEKAA